MFLLTDGSHSVASSLSGVHPRTVRREGGRHDRQLTITPDGRRPIAAEVKGGRFRVFERETYERSIAMAVRKFGKLDPETVERTMSEIKADPARKAETITTLLRVGARAFIEQSFELDDRQRKELSVLEHRDAEDVLQRALLLALVHDGTIRVVHEGHEQPNLDVEVSVGINDRGEFFVEVSVSC